MYSKAHLFSLLAAALFLLGLLLAAVIYFTVPEVMSKIISSMSEFWQTMSTGMRVGTGIFLALVGIVALSVCLNLSFYGA